MPEVDVAHLRVKSLEACDDGRWVESSWASTARDMSTPAERLIRVYGSRAAKRSRG